LKQNFSKQVFGYFLAAKSDKENLEAVKLMVAKKEPTTNRREKL
jgi:hypothetical protein